MWLLNYKLMRILIIKFLIIKLRDSEIFMIKFVIIKLKANINFKIIK